MNINLYAICICFLLIFLCIKMKLISTKQYNLQIIYIIETNSFFYFEFKRLNCWYPRASLSLTNRPCQSEKYIQIYQLECILFLIKFTVFIKFVIWGTIQWNKKCIIFKYFDEKWLKWKCLFQLYHESS